jgi:hypothetical protein
MSQLDWCDTQFRTWDCLVAMTALPVPSLTAVSRRSGSAAAAAAARAAKNLPPSHTLEHDPWYRTGVLERSLSRNDAELAAVIELNRTLLVLRNQIKDLDPLVLLYLGNGTYQLNPAQDDVELGNPNNSSHETAAAAPPLLPDTLRDASVQFLLRLKLRRRLLNRLARRLNRVAFAMDGGSVGFVSSTASSPWQQGPTMGDAAPPALPRYGDLPIPYYLDQENMKEAIDTWKQIWTQWDNIPQDLVPATSAAEPVPLAATSALDPPNAAAEEPLNEPEPDEHASQPDPKITSVMRSAQSMPPIDYDDAYEKTTRSGSIATAFTLVQEYQPNKTMEDYQRLKPGELGIGASAFPSGVGGTGMAHPNSAAVLGTVEGKQEEFKRWQQALLAKIPAQPTFAELGLDHRVFCEQARLQQALEAKARASAQNEQEDAKESTNNAPDTKATESGGLKRSREEDSDDMKDDDASTESDKPPKKKMKSKEEPTDEPRSASPVMEEKSPVEKAEPKDEDSIHETDEQENSVAKKAEPNDDDDDDESHASGDNDDNKSDGPQDEAVNDEEVKPKRISLKPVPSFYLQDLKRIKLAHTELMISSLKEEARRRLNDSTRDYNVGKLH